MSKGIVAFVGLMFLVLGPVSCFASGANAREVQLDFRSQLGDTLGGSMPSINAGNYSPSQEFKDILRNYGYNSNGVYYGNRFPLYRVQYPYNGFSLHFNASFNFTQQDIQLGASEYWVRIPVVGYTVEEVYITYETVNYTDWPIKGFIPELARASNEPDAKRVIFDDTGVYIKLLYPLFPGEVGFSFFVLPRPGMSLECYIGNENYTEGDNIYNFFTYRLENIPPYDSAIFPSMITEYLPSSPPVSFLFQSGVDRGGYSSSWVEAGETFSYGHYYINTTDLNTSAMNATYPSIYLPFRSDEAIDFEIEFRIEKRGANMSVGLTNPYTLDSVNSTTVNVTGQLDYLLISCPYYLNFSAFPFILFPFMFFQINITPSSRVLLLTHYINETEGTRLYRTYGGNISIQYYYSFYMVVDFTTGIWSRATQYSMVSVVDLGWAQGYRFPGTTEIYIFLDTGREVYFQGSAAEIWDRLLEEEYTGVMAVTDAVNGLVEWLADDYINNLYRIGKYIYNGLRDLISYLISFSEEVWRLLTGPIFDYLVMIALGLVIMLALVLPQLGASILSGTSDMDQETENYKTAYKRGKKRARRVLRRNRGGES